MDFYEDVLYLHCFRPKIYLHFIYLHIANKSLVPTFLLSSIAIYIPIPYLTYIRYTSSNHFSVHVSIEKKITYPFLYKGIRIPKLAKITTLFPD